MRKFCLFLIFAFSIFFFVGCSDEENVLNEKKEVSAEVKEDNKLVFDSAMKPLLLSGNIEVVEEISVSSSVDKGETVPVYTVKCDAEKEDLTIYLARNLKDELVSFQLALTNATENQAELQEEYDDFVNRAYEILGYVVDSDEENFVSACEKVDSSNDDVKNVFVAMNQALVQAGTFQNNEYMVGVNKASEVLQNSSLEGNINQIYIRVYGENIEVINFNFYFDDAMNLVSLDYNIGQN